MIKDEELRNKLLKEFPAVPTHVQEDIEHLYLPQYIFYKRDGYNSCSGYCTSCGSPITFDDDLRSRTAHKYDVKHNVMDVCPNCGHEITFKGFGYPTGKLRDETTGNFIIFTVKNNVLYARAASCQMEFFRYGNDPPALNIYTSRFYAFTGGQSHEWLSAYFYTIAFNMWKKETREMSRESAPVFPLKKYEPPIIIGAEDICKLDEFRYCGIDQYMDYVTSTKRYSEYPYIPAIEYMLLYTKYPVITEQLIKAGYYTIVDEACRKNSGYSFLKRFNFRAKNLKKALKADKAEMSYYRTASASEISSYLDFKGEFSGEITTQKAIEIVTKLGQEGTRKFISCIRRSHSTVKKCVNYAERQGFFGEYGQRRLDLWNDSLGFLEKLNYPPDNPFVFPKDIDDTHGRLFREHQCKTRNIDVKKQDKLITDQEESLKRFIYENMLYRIVLPKDTADIWEEGRALQHCVGSYSERHANGKTHIFFIRKQWAPDERFYTVEVSVSGNIRQCYGFKNNRYDPKTPDILQFVREYQEYLDISFGREPMTENNATLYNGGMIYDRNKQRSRIRSAS